MPMNKLKTHKKRRQYAYWFGVVAEWRVVFYLKLRGYRILKRRYKTKVGEVDLVALKGKRLHFIEVKARQDGDCEGIVSYKQQRRIANASHVFIRQYRRYAQYYRQYDLVIVTAFLGLTLKPAAWGDG